VNKLVYTLINPLVKAVLRSPLHGAMSANTMVIEFKGRKSGRTYSTPVSYHVRDGGLHCFSLKRFGWWQNLSDGTPVRLSLKGRSVSGKPSVVVDEPEIMQAALTDFLIAVPRDAVHSGVALDAEKRPVAADVAAVVGDMVYITIELVE